MRIELHDKKIKIFFSTIKLLKVTIQATLKRDFAALIQNVHVAYYIRETDNNSGHYSPSFGEMK